MPHLERPGFCSLLVAVDDHYLHKMLMTYPTWVWCHPEIAKMTHVIVYDSDQVKWWDYRWTRIREELEEACIRGNHQVPDFQLIPTGMLKLFYTSQREKMLTSLLRASEEVPTPWYLKLDADTYASARTGFYYDKWFNSNPVFIANPWGYAKPGDELDKLNAWAKDNTNIPDSLMKHWPVPGEKVMRDNQRAGDIPWKVNWSRMASWVMFGMTQWTQRVSLFVDPWQKYPTPSQDTYLSYFMRMAGESWIPVKFRQYGWEHQRNFNGLQIACRDVLEKVRGQAQ